MEEQPEVPGNHLEHAELQSASICRQMALQGTAATDEPSSSSSCIKAKLQHKSAVITSLPSHVLLHLKDKTRSLI